MSNERFKVGDKVRCAEQDTNFWLVVGKEYTITYVHPDGDVKILEQGFERCMFQARRFVAVSPAPPVQEWVPQEGDIFAWSGTGSREYTLQRRWDGGWCSTEAPEGAPCWPGEIPPSTVTFIRRADSKPQDKPAEVEKICACHFSSTGYAFEMKDGACSCREAPAPAPADVLTRHECPLCSGPCEALPPFSELESLMRHGEIAMTRRRISRQRADQEAKLRRAQEAESLCRLETNHKSEVTGLAVYQILVRAAAREAFYKE